MSSSAPSRPEKEELNESPLEKSNRPSFLGSSTDWAWISFVPTVLASILGIDASLAIGNDSWRVMLVPVVVAAIPLAAPRRTLLCPSSTCLLLAWTTLSLPSVGLFYLPAVAAMAVATFLSRRPT